MRYKEVGDIIALACTGEVESLIELGLGPSAEAKEFLDHTVEASTDGLVEQGEVFARTFGDANALASFEGILKGEELAPLD
jgi:hypothetical protein